MAFEELKRRQSVGWGAAPFERVAAEIADVHDDLEFGAVGAALTRSSSSTSLAVPEALLNEQRLSART